MSLADAAATPRTQAARRAVQSLNDGAADDLRFMENWQRQESPSLGAMLRARQIRRANPILAAEIEAEVNRRS